MRKILSLLSATAMITAACSENPVVTHGPATAQLSVIQALDPGDAVALQLDNAPLLTPLAGANAIAAGPHHLAVLTTSGHLLASGDFTAAANSHHTALIAGSVSASVSM